MEKTKVLLNRLKSTLKKIAKRGKCLRGFLLIKEYRDKIIFSEIPRWEKNLAIKEMEEIIEKFSESCGDDLDRANRKIFETFAIIVKEWKEIKEKLEKEEKLTDWQRFLLNFLPKVFQEPMQLSAELKGTDILTEVMEAIPSNDEDLKTHLRKLFNENKERFYISVATLGLERMEKLYDKFKNPTSSITPDEISEIMEFSITFLYQLYKTDKELYDKFIASL